MKAGRWVLFLGWLVWGAGTALAQDTAQSDPFRDLRFLVGAWTGHETGAAGIGKGTRE